jgi:hypothetical protein
MSMDKPLPKVVPDQEGMRLIGQLLKEMLPAGIGFTLLTFNYGEAGLCNYLSSAHRDDMIKGLRETADRLEGGKGLIATPNQN